ncbi:MAG: hypothetical protein IPH48_22225 [bacterium]|nr:hypothetical protein [bacterium]
MKMLGFATRHALPFLLLVPAAALAATPAGESPVIELPEQSPRHREIVLHEQWRIGAGDEDPVLGPIIDAVADPAGNVYLLDMQQQVLMKFSPDGQYLGPVARHGEGPGEIEHVYSVILLDDDRLGLVKSFPAEVVVVGLDGTPRSSLRPQAPTFGEGTGFPTLSTIASRDGHLIVAGRVSHFEGQVQHHTDYVASLSADGASRHCYGTHVSDADFSREITVDELRDWSACGIWTLGRGGEMYLAPHRDHWLIEVRDQDGTLLRTITRPVVPRRRTAAEKEAAKNRYSFASDTQLPQISYRMADTDPVIGGLYFDGSELHVHGRDRSAAEPGTKTFDVLDAEGRLLETRTVRLPGCGKEDGLFLLDDGRAICVKNLKAAMAAVSAGSNVQVGDKKRDAREVDGGEDLELILFAPAP